VLYFETGDKASGTCAVFLDDDEAPISFFGVGDGATIFMNEVSWITTRVGGVAIVVFLLFVAEPNLVHGNNE